MPLMKRTVREESGASSSLKNAAVRANETAKSLEFTVLPKSPSAVWGAPGFWKTARIRPARSTTAMTSASDTDAAAFCTRLCTSAWAKVGVVVPLTCDVAAAVLGVLEPPPQHMHPAQRLRTNARFADLHSKRLSKKRPHKKRIVVPLSRRTDILRGLRRDNNCGAGSEHYGTNFSGADYFFSSRSPGFHSPALSAVGERPPNASP